MPGSFFVADSFDTIKGLGGKTLAPDLSEDMLRQYFAQEENAEPFPPKYEEVADDAAVLKGQRNRKSVSRLPGSDDRKRGTGGKICRNR